MTDESIVGRFGSGREVRRIEDAELLVGAGRFVDDVSLPSQAYMRFLRSPHAHARIVSIDAEAAKAMPGVIAVLTGADLAAAGVKRIPLAPMFHRPDGSPGASPLRPALAEDTVRFVGEGIAASIAETVDQAKDALEAITVEYEELPVVTGVKEATAEGAPQVWPAATGNIAARMRHGDAALADAAFKSAAHVVTLDLVNQRLAPTPMEPRSVLASYDEASDRLTLRLSSQMPSAARDTLCNDVLGIPPSQVRVVVDDVGGGFGMKTGLYPEDIVVAFASRAIKRPVRWTAERIEEFLAATQGRDVESRAELALDANGKVLAYRVRSLANMGAYAGTAGIIIQLLVGPWVSTSIYDIKTIDLQFDAVLTNTAPTAAYRGAGRPEAIYLIERIFDAAARQLGLDPVEIRRRNLISPEQMPYTNAMGQVYDSGKFEFDPRPWTCPRQMERFRGSRSGISRAREAAGPRPRLVPGMDGRQCFRGARHRLGLWRWRDRSLRVDHADGTGHCHLLRPARRRCLRRANREDPHRSGRHRSRLRVRQRGLALSVHRRLGDQPRFPEGGGEGRDLASDALEAAAADIEYREGMFRVAGTDRQIGLFELADRQPEHRIYVDSTSKVEGPSWPNACHVCEVEIDPETGAVEVVSYVSANDIGRVVNPMIVRGQLDGGAVQGIGQALCEQIVYDRASGQATTASFMDYAMPRSEWAPFHHVLDQSIPCRNNPLGAKGVGELGTIGATPAVVIGKLALSRLSTRTEQCLLLGGRADTTRTFRHVAF